MILHRRLLAAPASPALVVAARMCAITIASCMLSAAASAAVTRVHRLPAASEKPQAVVQQSSPGKDRDKDRGKKEDKEQDKHPSAPVAKNHAKAKPEVAHRKKATPRQPEVVDDPIPMHRAAREAAKQKYIQAKLAAASQTASRKPVITTGRSARERRDAHRQPEAPTVVIAASDTAAKAAQSNKLSVDDFVQAAEGTASESTDARADAVIAQPVASQPPVQTQQKPAPIVRHAPPALAQIKAADAEPIPTPADQTVEGFGGEVETLTPRVSAKALTASKHAVATDKDATPTAEERNKITDDAMQPLAAPLYTRSGKLMMPLPLKGTREILVHQNQMADDAGLTRIQDDDDLNRMRAEHLLVSFPEMTGLEVNDELPINRRYARPWTVKFVSDLARAYYAKFHEPLRLNSAVRTVDYQRRLQRVNGNAAAVDGDAASPHLTGQAIDFGKHGMSIPEIAWMRDALLPLMQAGKIDVEEEFQQACFHISVYTSYAPKKRVAPKTELAQLHRE